jgi:hypothetical protein
VVATVARARSPGPSYTAPVLKYPPSRLNHLMKMMMAHIYWLSLRGTLEPIFDWYFERTRPEMLQRAHVALRHA